MKSQSAGLKVASVLFGLAALVHLLRLFINFQVIVGSYYISRKLSLLAVIIGGFLCIWLWRLACGSCKAAETSALPPH